MSKPHGARILLALPVLLALASGCGAGAAKQAPSPAEPAADMPADAGGDAEVSSAEPPTVDEAAANFESAESSLEALLVGGADPAPPAPAPSALAPSAAGPGEAPEKSPEAQRYGTDGRCTRACRALASMRRSADRLCSLTSRDDPRCVNVVGRLGRAEQRVEASCPGCSS